MSFFLAEETDVETALAGYPGDSLVAVTAAQIRALGAYRARRAPTDDNPAHVLVCPKLSRSDAKKLISVTRWVVRKV